MTTMVAPASGAGPTSPAARFGRMIADRLRGVPGAIDVAVLGVPGADGGEVVPLGGGDERVGVSVRLYGSSVIVAATPGAPGPCPRCLDRRWTVCRPTAERAALEEPRGVLAPVQAVPGSHAAAIAASLVETALRGGDPRTAPVWEIDTLTSAVNRFGLIRDSACERCARPVDDTAEGARITLAPAPVAPGATRTRRPEDLDLPVEALANPVCGMLGGPAVRAYQATATAPVSGRLHVRSKYALHEMWWSGHAESYARSELLAALEGLERDAGQRPRRVRVARRARAADLDAPHLDLTECGLYSEEFYRGHTGHYVPWSEQPEVPWVWGYSLRDERPLLVPEQIAYYLDHRTDHRNTVQECSNGCASGGSVTEAVLHGLLELLERDAFLVSWYGGLTPTEIDLDTVDSALVRQMRAHVDLFGYDLRCFDIRTDLPVPAVAAVAVRRDDGLGTLCFAGGASLDPADAVRAAVCETASYISGFPERVEAALERVERMADDYRLVTELSHHALLFGLPRMAPLADHWLRQDERRPLDEVFADWTAGRGAHRDLREPVREIVAMLADRGMDTVVVDQTTPEQRLLGLHTVAVIVPGLVPIDFGWERQRALHLPRTRWAPHRAGLMPRPLRADELHRVPHPFP
ncbi:TOMM precursor leader peptide-binding protein [Thermobifida halotolerans]|uniref:TOMM leader peptide-binding protein n=1 Tax=Thermobifida halotolerans TaxID=483545 RepID=A0AA97M532_9ACTN|nr:TOMM precursor leader peptide-binding protein [Thermobifida halotolerans]UOE20620.1 TOMM precursor leader peptide-binding protein [Thermobifida halotolerans]